MITELKIQNFKAHKDTQIKMGNLTVLAGVNSAGKSSIIQALLLLRQSFLTNKLSQGLDLQGRLCKIGTGRDTLFRFADTNKMVFEIECDGQFRFEYDVENFLNDSFIKKSDYIGSYERLEEISLFNTDFQYISTLRLGGTSHFDRYDYEVKEQKQISIEFGKGEAVAHFLHENRGEIVTDYLKSGKDRSLAVQVELWEQLVSPNVTIDVQVNPSNKGFDIIYGYRNLEWEKPITDLRAENIGYGVSHSLPIVTALLSAKPGALIILENPEAHLHPKGQAELAKLISRVAQHGVQVIVETHSDHIINGILVAAKQFEDGNEKEKQMGIDRNNVRMYYIDRDKEKQAFAVAEEVKIAEHGRLEFQPKGFFDQAEEDWFYLNAL